MAVLTDPVTTWMAFASTWISNVISVYLICTHVRNYTQPGFQRYICRIVFIVPFYCTASWLALLHREYSLYFETPRDCYEAWVIYNFMSLCFAYVGGPGAVVVKSEGKVIKPSWILCTCCMKPIPVDGFFLRNCKQGTLQFVIAKPFLAFFTLMLFVMGKYTVGDWGPTDGYPYIAFIYNLCYAIALFWMLLFYVGCDELLHPYKPLLKFFVFKTVIFLTFWQGLAITFLATRFGWDESDAEAIMNWMICVEMFFAAVGMVFAFPASEYSLGGAAAPGWNWESFKHAISITDVIEDIMLQFNPDYKSYVLHTDGGPSENVKRKKFRGKKKKKPAFSLGLGELGEFAHKIKMPKLKNFNMRSLGMSTDGGTAGETTADEEGGLWHSAVRRDNILTDVRDMTLRTVNQAGVVAGKVGQVAKTGLSWIPGLDPLITELERDQAQLLDSDSDAEMDEENQMDNQLDDDVLTSSDSEDVVLEDGSVRHRPGHHHRGPRGNGVGRSRHARLASDSDEDKDGDETDGLYQQKGGRLRTAATSDSDAAGGYGRRSKAAASDWAQFPNPNAAAQDSSWAQFPGEPGAPAAAAAAGADDWAKFDEVPLDGTGPAPKPEPAMVRTPSNVRPVPSPSPPSVLTEGEEGEEEEEVEEAPVMRQVQEEEASTSLESDAEHAADAGAASAAEAGAGEDLEVAEDAEPPGYTAAVADDEELSNGDVDGVEVEVGGHGDMPALEEKISDETEEELSLGGSPLKGSAGEDEDPAQFDASFNPTFENPATFNPTFEDGEEGQDAEGSVAGEAEELSQDADAELPALAEQATASEVSCDAVQGLPAAGGEEEGEQDSQDAAESAAPAVPGVH